MRAVCVSMAMAGFLFSQAIICKRNLQVDFPYYVCFDKKYAYLDHLQ